MPSSDPTLHILCGKIASGKSTLAARLGAVPGTVLISEDIWLDALFADELSALEDYARCSKKLRQAMAPHVASMLDAGISVVLDFSANTPRQRKWLKRIVEKTGANHQLHVLNVPDDVCIERLRARNASGDHPFVVTDALFHEVTRYFSLPSPDEGFDVVSHDL